MKINDNTSNDNTSRSCYCEAWKHRYFRAEDALRRLRDYCAERRDDYKEMLESDRFKTGLEEERYEAKYESFTIIHSAVNGELSMLNQYPDKDR